MFGRRSQRDFEDEIRSHLQMEIERLEAQGMSRADAERMARRNFGNVGVAEDNFYHGQRLAWLEDAGRDLRHAARAMRVACRGRRPAARRSAARDRSCLR